MVWALDTFRQIGICLTKNLLKKKKKKREEAEGKEDQRVISVPSFVGADPHPHPFEQIFA